MRTEQQIIDQTNELARQLYAVRGYNTTRKLALSSASKTD